MAGERAQHSAQRQRDKAERLTRSAELYERGAVGERETASALSLLRGEGWTVLHDLRWPGRRYANIDHVVIGPSGVFVIDSKNWSGVIKVSGDVIRQGGRAREAAVTGAVDAAVAVGRLAPTLREDLIYPVICFVRDEPMTGRVREVLVCSTANVLDLVRSRPAVLTTQEVRSLVAELRGGLAGKPHVETTGRRARLANVARAGSTARSRARPPSKRRRSGTGQLLRLGIFAAVAAVIALRPEVLTDVTAPFADWLSGQFTEGVGSDPSPKG